MKTLSDHYEEIYERVSLINQQEDEKEVEFFADLVNSEQKLDILDLGCAEGKLSIKLALRGHRVTATDISQGFLNKTLKLAAEDKVKVAIIKCNIEEGISEFGQQKFDAIYFMDIIEHLKNLVSALNNVRKILKENGTLIIHTPNVCEIGRFLRYLIKPKELRNYYAPHCLGDLHLYTYDYSTLEKTLNFVGFRIVEVIPTTLSLPKINMKRYKFLINFSKFLSRLFPFLSDNLLVKCKKEKPIDVDQQILFWAKQHKIN